MKPIYKRLTVIIALVLTALIIYIMWENQTITVSKYQVSSKKLPTEFDGFCIVQVSDLHCAEFDEGNNRLLSLIKDAKPDIIVITGDLFDARRGDREIGASFVSEAVKIAPTYFVTGNHEFANDDFDTLEPLLSDAGVFVLRNSSMQIYRGENAITILGIDDPLVMKEALIAEEITGDEIITDELTATLKGVSGYTVLLAHHPEYIDKYAEHGVDLVFSGHAHGGQFRFPLIGGLYAPGQGVFPKYTEGVHEYDDTAMIVSRGLGRSSFPFRFGNPPELVVVTLECE